MQLQLGFAEPLRVAKSLVEHRRQMRLGQPMLLKVWCMLFGRWVGLVGWGGLYVSKQPIGGVASGALFGPVGCFEDFGRGGPGVKFQNDSQKSLDLSQPRAEADSSQPQWFGDKE